MSHRYTYRVEFSSRSGQYVARCLEIPPLREAGPTASEAMTRAETATDRYLEDMAGAIGGEPPEPFADHDFSGNFLVRTSGELHSRLTMEAAEQGVSLNQWVVQKLANRPPALDW